MSELAWFYISGGDYAKEVKFNVGFLLVNLNKYYQI